MACGGPATAVAAGAAGTVLRSGPVTAQHPLRLTPPPRTRTPLLAALDQDPGAGTAAAAPPRGAPGSGVAAPLLLQSWPGTSQTAQIQALGPADETVTPPDPAVAVGTGWVVESTSEALFVYQRDGRLYPDRPGATCPAPGPTWLGYTPYSLGGCDSIDLNDFVNSDGWALSDPRVVYDAGAGQFYLTFTLSTTATPTQSCAAGSPAGDSCSMVFVFHTTSGDPTGQWAGEFFRTYYDNVIAARPMVGFSSDKVALSWDEESAAGHWYGDELLVMSKALFLAGATQPVIDPAGGRMTAPETSHFSLTPVTGLSSGSTLYVVANDAASDLVPGEGADLNVLAVTGDTSGLVAEAPAELPLAGGFSTSPPAAPQQGSSALILTGDDRIESAVWSNGALWTGFDESCTPAGDTAARACIRYLELSTDSMQLLTQIDFGITGAYAYYPSFGIDPQGDLFTTFTASSSHLDPSVLAMGIPAGQAAFSSPVTVAAGAGPYDYPSSLSPSTLCDPAAGGCPFGVEAGGAMDPVHPQDFWFADEAQLDAVNPADWGTVLGRLSYAAPSITNLTPSVGPATGGTVVTVNGSDFGPGTSLSFAGASVTVSDLTPDSFTFTTPAEAAGSVSGTAIDALGSSGAAPYLYVAPSLYQPLTPYRVLDTRAPSCVQCGSGALGAAETRTIQIAGYEPPGFTGTIVPASATAVVLNVTAVAGSQGTYLTVFPAGGGVPTASNLNPGAGQNIANLVTVALGTAGEVSIYNALGTIGAVADVEGYYLSGPGSAGAFHVESPPVRVCDTRGGQGTACNSGSSSPLGPDQSRLVAVAGGSTGVSTGGNAEAAVLNLTAVSGSAATYLSVYPPTQSAPGPPTCGGPPLVSNLNVAANTNQPNRVVTPLLEYEGTGYICVFNDLGTINVAIDVNGWFGDGEDAGGAHFYALGPSRICDTRYTQGTQCAGDTLAPGEALSVQVDGTGPLPATGVTALVANVTAVSGSAATYLSVYPEAMYPPGTSDLNPPAQTNIANLVIVAIAADGRLDIYNSVGSIDVVVDAVGWYQ